MYELPDDYQDGHWGVMSDIEAVRRPGMTWCRAIMPS